MKAKNLRRSDSRRVSTSVAIEAISQNQESSGSHFPGIQHRKCIAVPLGEWCTQLTIAISCRAFNLHVDALAHFLWDGHLARPNYACLEIQQLSFLVRLQP